MNPVSTLNAESARIQRSTRNHKNLANPVSILNAANAKIQKSAQHHKNLVNPVSTQNAASARIQRRARRQRQLVNYMSTLRIYSAQVMVCCCVCAIQNSTQGTFVVYFIEFKRSGKDLGVILCWL